MCDIVKRYMSMFGAILPSLKVQPCSDVQADDIYTNNPLRTSGGMPISSDLNLTMYFAQDLSSYALHLVAHFYPHIAQWDGSPGSNPYKQTLPVENELTTVNGLKATWCYVHAHAMETLSLLNSTPELQGLKDDPSFIYF